MRSPKLLVIKIGSNVLTLENGLPDLEQMAELVAQMAWLKNKGIQLVLVSSGAVAFGRKSFQPTDKIDPVVKKQIWASMGQIELIQTYLQLFKGQGLQVAQVLVTKEDFRDRKHYLNMRNCLMGLLKNGILPIINENDAVAVTELMFTDNDELAGLTAAMINADSLLLLTNVDGIYTGHPLEEGSELIQKVDRNTSDLKGYIRATSSSFGRGGMLTKMTMAQKSADLGIQVMIANGKKPGIIQDFFQQTIKGTYFEPQKPRDNAKKWLAHGEQYSKGEVVINDGAAKALASQKIISLLPIGVMGVNGDFAKGEIVRIVHENGEKLGLGKAEYSAKTAQEKLGKHHQKAIIHYDYLYLF
ncbi:glutamate 5-kinase [Pararhodonellum marinum]|uniref:glutamate 5-kinase n=1 Tax=Pararhodonellum marinum TaxID=2755358 RepID=UPI0018905CB0|nr:glutamate 5-kinase [Pararhodonellum marinum]